MYIEFVLESKGNAVFRLFKDGISENYQKKYPEINAKFIFMINREECLGCETASFCVWPSRMHNAHIMMHTIQMLVLH